MAADQKVLSDLHTHVARELTDIIKNGIEEEDSEGNTKRVKAPASYFTVAVKFLKDNGIDAIPDKSADLGALANALPEFEDDDTAPIRPN